MDYHSRFYRLEEGEQGREGGYVARVVGDVGEGVPWGTQVQHGDGCGWGLRLCE